MLGRLLRARETGERQSGRRLAASLPPCLRRFPLSGVLPALEDRARLVLLGFSLGATADGATGCVVLRASHALGDGLRLVTAAGELATWADGETPADEMRKHLPADFGQEPNQETDKDPKSDL